MLAGLKRLLKETFYDGKETLSITRVMIAAVFAQVTAIVWLCVWWIRHLTLTGQMESGALLAQAVFGGLAGILGTQVAGAAFSYFVQNKFGSGGIAGRQLDISDARAVIVAGEEPAYIPEIGPEIVPDDTSEPRVAAESPSSATSTVELTAADPLPVEITDASRE